jgi:hypothetical protein
MNTGRYDAQVGIHRIVLGINLVAWLLAAKIHEALFWVRKRLFGQIPISLSHD